MKIIHCADIHLGSRLVSKFPKEISDERKTSLRTSYRRMVDYAKDNDVKVIILSGDVFDSDKPAIKDKKYFYSIIKNYPDIDFLYLNGNHDKESSYTAAGFSNLKTFNKNDFVSYEYGDVVISGIEMDENNCDAFYSKLNLDSSRINIVMLHGSDSACRGKDLVKISDLRGKGIDYLALGHIHSYKHGMIDERGQWVFPGCLEPRGFDECGEKGFVLLDITDHIEHKFISFPDRVIHYVKVCVTDSADLFEIENKVNESVSKFKKNDILLVELIGELPVDLDVSEKDIENALSSYYYVHVRNKTSAKIDTEELKKEHSIISEFISRVEANAEYDDVRKKEIISAGVRLLLGKEVE